MLPGLPGNAGLRWQRRRLPLLQLLRVRLLRLPLRVSRQVPRIMLPQLLLLLLPPPLRHKALATRLIAVLVSRLLLLLVRRVVGWLRP